MSERAGTPVRRRPRIAFELLTLGWLLVVYDQIRSHAEVRGASAIATGRQVLRLETWAHLDVELALNTWTSAHRFVTVAAASWYQYAHLSVTMGVLVWCWWRRPALYRWARTSLVLVNVVGLFTFLLLPVAPPRLLPGTAYVDSGVQAGFGAGPLSPVQADQYGAMPSLHVGWAVWVAVVCVVALRPHRLARLWLLYPCVTTVVILLTANHYVLDAVAGLLAVTVALLHARVPGWGRLHGWSSALWPVPRSSRPGPAVQPSEPGAVAEEPVPVA